VQWAAIRDRDKAEQTKWKKIKGENILLCSWARTFETKMREEEK